WLRLMQGMSIVSYSRPLFRRLNDAETVVSRLSQPRWALGVLSAKVPSTSNTPRLKQVTFGVRENRFRNIEKQRGLGSKANTVAPVRAKEEVTSPTFAPQSIKISSFLVLI